jgi:hypothetical protein
MPISKNATIQVFAVGDAGIQNGAFFAAAPWRGF